MVVEKTRRVPDTSVLPLFRRGNRRLLVRQLRLTRPRLPLLPLTTSNNGRSDEQCFTRGNGWNGWAAKSARRLNTRSSSLHDVCVYLFMCYRKPRSRRLFLESFVLSMYIRRTPVPELESIQVLINIQCDSVHSY